MTNFHGVKIALFFNNHAVTILRDNKPNIDFPGLWDFPGGGRENNETPEACMIREVQEELTLEVKYQDIIWKKQYASMSYQGQESYFMAATITQQQIDSIKFGNEGRKWKLMSFDEILEHPKFIQPLKDRFQDFLDASL